MELLQIIFVLKNGGENYFLSFLIFLLKCGRMKQFIVNNPHQANHFCWWKLWILARVCAFRFNILVSSRQMHILRQTGISKSLSLLNIWKKRKQKTDSRTVRKNNQQETNLSPSSWKAVTFNLSLSHGADHHDRTAWFNPRPSCQ